MLTVVLLLSEPVKEELLGGKMRQIAGFILLFVISIGARAELDRVPAIFNGDSPAPAYLKYENYRTLKDSRDSRPFAEYFLDLRTVQDVLKYSQLNRVHVQVRNIAKDGLCDDKECFRAYVFINGDENHGSLVATFVVSPGTGKKTPEVEDLPLRKYDPDIRWLKSYEKSTAFLDWDMYRIYGSKSYPGKVPNMPNALFFLDAIALHGSFDVVNGTKQSHGCIRMFPDESYWLHSLVREAEGNLTVDVMHTES